MNNLPPLSDEDISRMKALGREVCTHVAYSARRTENSRTNVRWNPAGMEGQVDLFVGEDVHPDPERTLSYMCGVTNVSATIDEVADLFNSDVEVASNFYGHFHQDLANYQLLATIRPRTRQYPRHMISLKTATMLSPSPSANSRDFVYLESQEDVMDAKRSKRGWVCAMHSIDLPNAGPRHDVVRGSLYRSGFVFTESDTPGVLEAIYLLQVDFKGPIPVHVRQTMMKQRIMCLQALAGHFSQGIQHSSQLHSQPQVPIGSSRYTEDARYTRETAMRQPQHNDSPNRFAPPEQPRFHPPTYSSVDMAKSTQPGVQGSQFNSQNNNAAAAVNSNMARSLSSSAISGVQLLGDIHLKPKHAATQCACCVSGFGFLKKKHNCRVCGEVVCSSCCTQQRPAMPIEGIKKYHICTLCTMDNRKSTTRTASSNGGGAGRSKSEHTRSVLSASHKSPKSSLSGSHPTRFKQQSIPPHMVHPDRQIIMRPRNDQMYDENSSQQPDLPRNYIYGKPQVPGLQVPSQGPPRVVMTPSPAPPVITSAAYHQSGQGYNKPQQHHHYPPQAPQFSQQIPPRYRPQLEHEMGRHQPGGYAPSMASSYQVPQYNGKNRPDDPRVPMREERESFFMYEEVGTSVSRAQHPQQPTKPANFDLPTQEVYIPADAPTTTAVNLGDLKNATDVLAALNNDRGKEKTLRLEIIPQPLPARSTKPPFEPEREPYSYNAPQNGVYRGPPAPTAAPRYDNETREPRESHRYVQPQVEIPVAQPPISNTPAPPVMPKAASPAPDDSQVVPQQQPLGIYKGSRYRIKETRYYAPATDTNPDDYLAQERDSILVDMPSQGVAAKGTTGTSPTAITVSKFLDQDIDMFLQPMDKKKSKESTSQALQLENGQMPNSSMNDLIASLQAKQNATVDTSTESDVQTLTRLLLARLRVASESERLEIKETLKAVVDI